MMRAASMTFGLLAVALVGFAGYRYITDRDCPPGEAIIIHAPDRELGSQLCGAEILVRFRITNTSSRPIRVVGLAPACGQNACFGPKQMDLFEVPPRGEVEIECIAIAYEPGPFECPMAVNWYEDGEYHGLRLSVSGTAIAPRAADHAKKSP